MPPPTSPIAKTLNQIGLSEKEATVYEALLLLGKANMGKLLPKVPYKRGNTYDILGDLIKKGLVLETEERGKKVFTVEPPEQLKALVEKNEHQLNQQKKVLQSNFEQLASTYRLTMNKPGVRFFEGQEGIIKIYEELLSNNQPIDSIEEKGDLLEYIPDYAPIYIKTRVQKKLFNRVISPDTNALNKTNSDKFIEARLIPVNKFPFRMDIKISGHKISLITFQKKNAVGVLIDNEEIANNFKILFNFLWSTLPSGS
ncbi:MAG: helix-turn-helix domain-containing protein [Patescibacteria group bacterium]|jgi:sugar-specific transcriptional regulator TrmB